MSNDDINNEDNQIMDNNDEDTFLSSDFNSLIKLKIEKTYIDEVNFINNLSGTLNFSNSKISDLPLDTIYNNKKINFSIIKNNKDMLIQNFFQITQNL